MKVLLISGSPGENSHTLALLGYLAERLESAGAEAVLWDLRRQVLPQADPTRRNAHDPFLRSFKAEISSADAVVLGTPTHHSSYSGLLKNALDNLEYDAFGNKPVGLTANAGGARGCMLPCEHLRSVVRAMSGYALQIQVGTCDQDFADVAGRRQLVNAPILKRCAALVSELQALAGALKTLAVPA